jgi:hypothetical protein
LQSTVILVQSFNSLNLVCFLFGKLFALFLKLELKFRFDGIDERCMRIFKLVLFSCTSLL